MILYWMPAYLYGFGGLMWFIFWAQSAYDVWPRNRKRGLRFAWLTPIWPFVIVFVVGRRFLNWLWGLWDEAWGEKREG